MKFGLDDTGRELRLATVRLHSFHAYKSKKSDTFLLYLNSLVILVS